MRLLSDLTGELMAKCRAGELDIAAVLVPEHHTPPAALLTDIIATDRMTIVASRRAQFRAPTWRTLSGMPWVLNPPGCLLRAALLDVMDKAGAPASVAAEIHNMHLQLAFIEAGYGLGLLPQRFVRRHGARGALRVVEPKGFDQRMAVAVIRAGPLGSFEAAAQNFKDQITHMFAS